MKILLIGGGGHCKSVIDVIEQEQNYKIAGIIDKKELIGKEILGYKVIGCDDDLKELRKIYSKAIITVGQIYSNTIRVKLFQQLKELEFELPVIVSPKAYISKHSFVDEGTIIMHNAIINADAKLERTV